MNDFPEVPAVTYHSIADHYDHPWNFLSIPVRLFDRQLRYLKRKGFHTITLYEVSEYLKHGATLPPNAVVLTFDDGYLDNWVFVYPLLKKYGMKATLFVATDFVDPRNLHRPNIEAVWSGITSMEDLEWWGYLSWEELREMCQSGIIDVQSHSRTHTWHFSGDKIVDFHHPGDFYFWLSWNARPDDKYTWLNQEFREWVPWGTPVYEHSQALLTKRYHEDPGFTQTLVDHVQRRGGTAFFNQPVWKDELFEVATQYRSTHPSKGFFESEADYLRRVRDEMNDSKETIERVLDKRIDFFCWPSGDFTESLHRMAIEECDYLATVTTERKPNRFGNDPSKIDRTYFRADYRGPWREQLIFLNFCATVNSQSGVPMTRWIVPFLGKGLTRFLDRWGRWRSRTQPFTT